LSNPAIPLRYQRQKWAELDFCLKWDSGAKGFKGLAQEYRFRKDSANAEYKNQVGYIWVADEIDVTMADLTKDEAKPFKDALKMVVTSI
jgi:hypothetical protein